MASTHPEFFVESKKAGGPSGPQRIAFHVFKNEEDEDDSELETATNLFNRLSVKDRDQVSANMEAVRANVVFADTTSGIRRINSQRRERVFGTFFSYLDPLSREERGLMYTAYIRMATARPAVEQTLLGFIATSTAEMIGVQANASIGVDNLLMLANAAIDDRDERLLNRIDHQSQLVLQAIAVFKQSRFPPVIGNTFLDVAMLPQTSMYQQARGFVRSVIRPVLQQDRQFDPIGFLCDVVDDSVLTRVPNALSLGIFPPKDELRLYDDPVIAEVFQNGSAIWDSVSENVEDVGTRGRISFLTNSLLAGSTAEHTMYVPPRDRVRVSPKQLLGSYGASRMMPLRDGTAPIIMCLEGWTIPDRWYAASRVTRGFDMTTSCWFTFPLGIRGERTRNPLSLYVFRKAISNTEVFIVRGAEFWRAGQLLSYVAADNDRIGMWDSTNIASNVEFSMTDFNNIYTAESMVMPFWRRDTDLTVRKFGSSVIIDVALPRQMIIGVNGRVPETSFYMIVKYAGRDLKHLFMRRACDRYSLGRQAVNLTDNARSESTGIVQLITRCHELATLSLPVLAFIPDFKWPVNLQDFSAPICFRASSYPYHGSVLGEQFRASLWSRRNHHQAKPRALSLHAYAEGVDDEYSHNFFPTKPEAALSALILPGRSSQPDLQKYSVMHSLVSLSLHSIVIDIAPISFLVSEKLAHLDLTGCVITYPEDGLALLLSKLKSLTAFHIAQTNFSQVVLRVMTGALPHLEAFSFSFTRELQELTAPILLSKSPNFETPERAIVDRLYRLQELNVYSTAPSSAHQNGNVDLGFVLRLLDRTGVFRSGMLRVFGLFGRFRMDAASDVAILGQVPKFRLNRNRSANARERRSYSVLVPDLTPNFFEFLFTKPLDNSDGVEHLFDAFEMFLPPPQLLAPFLKVFESIESCGVATIVVPLNYSSSPLFSQYMAHLIRTWAGKKHELETSRERGCLSVVSQPGSTFCREYVWNTSEAVLDAYFNNRCGPIVVDGVMQRSKQSHWFAVDSTFYESFPCWWRRAHLLDGAAESVSHYGNSASVFQQGDAVLRGVDLGMWKIRPPQADLAEAERVLAVRHLESPDCALLKPSHGALFVERAWARDRTDADTRRVQALVARMASIRFPSGLWGKYSFMRHSDRRAAWVWDRGTAPAAPKERVDDESPEILMRQQ
jgi:hypothetical protein